jgi:hypothetical protein
MSSAPVSKARFSMTALQPTSAGVLGWRPAYLPFGISTCATKK